MAMRRSVRIAAAFACTVMLICLGVLPSHAEKRVALVIGNSNYRQPFCWTLRCIGELRHPATDAAALAALFQTSGFQVVESRSDVGLSDMRRAIGDFAVTARDADIAVVYFAGHGIAIDGVNYLIPTDATLSRGLIEDAAVPLDRVLRAVG